MERQDEAVRLMASGLEKIEMPKREFISFDGDSKKYPRFMKSFEINVDRKVKEDDEKLSCYTVLQGRCEGCYRELFDATI